MIMYPTSGHEGLAVATTSAKESRIAKSRKQERTTTTEKNVNENGGKNSRMILTIIRSHSEKQQANKKDITSESKSSLIEKKKLKLKFQKKEHYSNKQLQCKAARLYSKSVSMQRIHANEIWM